MRMKMFLSEEEGREGWGGSGWWVGGCGVGWGGWLDNFLVIIIFSLYCRQLVLP